MTEWLPVPAFLAISVTALAGAMDTGSFGELIDLDRLIVPHDSSAHQASSYDRSGGNDDGAVEKNMVVRHEGDGAVVFDEQGPGCIYRVWSASPGEGWMRFYFDGQSEPGIDLKRFGDMFDGSRPPFVKPFSQGFLGAGNSYVPIPFRKSCKIVIGGKPGIAYLQITWRKLPSDQGVRTFTLELPPDEKQKMDQATASWSKCGAAPVPFGPDGKTIRKPFSTATAAIPLFNSDGAGIVRAVKLNLASADPLYLRKVLLRVFTDGREDPDVWSPVGDFFMTGFGGIETRGLMIGVKDGQMYCYFPIPFAKGIRVELGNEAGLSVTGDVELTYDALPALPSDALRFHAWWHRENPPVAGQPFTILEAQGQGHWCGLSLYMDCPEGLGFLEGDEQLYIDGRDKSDFNGTGTEDYFNCGWYFGTTGCLPLHGCTVRTEAPSYVHAYRVHISDLVPFAKEARIFMEHGPVNDREADYMGVAYWYAATSASHSFAATPIDKRLPRPITVLKAVEAETALVGAEGGEVTKTNEVALPFRLSAGGGIAFTPAGDNGAVRLALKTTDDCGYDVTAWFVTGPTGGRAQALLDGQVAGDVFDTYAPEPKLEKIIVGGVDRLPPGDHTLSFAARGKNAASQGQTLFVDCVRLSHKGILEGEDLKVIEKSNARLLPQVLRAEGQRWSDDMQLWFLPGGPGEFFTLELPVEKAGRYHAYAYMTKAVDYGIVQFKLDGQPVGEPFDGYAAGIARSPKLDLGDHELSAGTHALRVELIGKNEQSHGHLAGLDCIVLTPAE